MGCFLGCFKAHKERKRLIKSKRSSPVEKFPEEKGRYINLLQNHSPDLTATAVAAEGDYGNPVGKLSENQEQGAVATVRKKVTFDLNVTTFENVPVHEEPNDFSDNDGFERQVKEDEDKEEEDSNVSTKLVTYPTNHRYQNCESNDDEELDEEEEEFDFDEEGDEIGNEESYDSYFSLPLEGENKNFNEIDSPKPITSAINMQQVVTKANFRDRSTYIHSVLNPVENLSHWKEAKVRVATFNNLTKGSINLKMQAESFISSSPEPTLKAQRPQKPISLNPYYEVCAKEEIAVDASLSNWLISPNHSRLEPEKSNSILSKSSASQEERPILGALTMDDIKQASRNASLRSSPSRSNEEIPIVGTVGSYWSSKSLEDSISSWSSTSENRGIPNTTRKYREDMMVNWHSTPFETRLERALCEQS